MQPSWRDEAREAHKSLLDPEGHEAGESLTQIYTVRLIWDEGDGKIGRQKIIDKDPGFIMGKQETMRLR